MNKKNLLTSTALATALLVGKVPTIDSNANAQIKNFTGPYISLGASTQYDRVLSNNSASNIPTAATGATSVAAATNFVGFNSAATTIIGRATSAQRKENFGLGAKGELGYLFDFGGNFGLGIDLSFSPDRQNRSVSQNYTQSTISVEASSSYTVANVTGSQSIRIKDQYNIALSLKPSVAITNDLMVYAVGSVNQLKQKINVNFSLDTATNYSLSKEVFGYGLGIGARYNLDKNLFFDFSATNLTYDRYRVSRNDSNVTPAIGAGAGEFTTINRTVNDLSTAIKPEYYDIKLSIGYKF